jgi:hypothetical protein
MRKPVPAESLDTRSNLGGEPLDEGSAVASALGECLPWERPSGEPHGNGICLSGGGLRAAAFSLGAIQALQKERGLLYGPKAADHLAAVSGGSYIGTAFMLTACQGDQELHPPPLDPQAPETGYVISHGRYLTEDGPARSVARFVPRLIANALSGVVMFLWSAVMLADAVVLLDHFTPVPTWPSQWRGLSLPVFFTAVSLFFASTITDRSWKRHLWLVMGGAGIASAAPSLISAIRDSPVLSSPNWWKDHPTFVAFGLATYLGATIASALNAFMLRLPRFVRGASDAVTRNAPRLVSALILCFAIAQVQPRMADAFDYRITDAEALVFLLLFFGILVIAIPASVTPDAVSLHRPYRDLLSRCFGVRRRPDSQVEAIRPTTDARSSSFKSAHVRVPRLLVCATANVRTPRGERGWKGTVAPFVFSHDRCGLAGIPGAWFDTRQLEIGRARLGFTRRKTEPELSAMGAVGISGAAVAPSMGDLTMTGLRPLLAMLNARLGVWLPNPLSATRRLIVASRPNRPPAWSSRRRESGSLGPGFEALVAEFFGIHTMDARRIYITDGGHYDNLGLLALLRARSKTIWCVDAYQNRRHLGRQLERVVELAQRDLSVSISIDAAAFRLLPRSDSVAVSAVAIGEIDYPETDIKGTLVVIKLALTTTTPPALTRYRELDRRFPYHPTWRQWFDQPRFEQYVRLGHHVASEALSQAPSEALS